MYKVSLKRGLGYGGLFAVLLAFLYPVQYAMHVFSENSYNFERAQSLSGRVAMGRFDLYGPGLDYIPFSVIMCAMLMMLAPLVLALIFNGYMYSKSASDVFHAMPLRRETMLCANAAAAMTLIAVPVAACTLATSVMSIIRFGFDGVIFAGQLSNIIGWLICQFAVYAVVTLVGVLVGTVFDTVIFSGMLLLSPLVIYLLVSSVNACFLYGYAQNDMSLVLYLSPVTAMPIHFAFYLGGEIMAFALYLAVGVLAFWLAAFLYKRRKSELAQSHNTRGVLPIIGKFLATFIIGVMFGLFFYVSGNKTFIPWVAIMGAVTYVVAEVILARGFHTLLKSLPVGAATVALTVALCLMPMCGGFGFETYVPEPDAVEYADITDYTGLFENDVNSLYSRDWRSRVRFEAGSPALETLNSLHKKIIENRTDEKYKTRSFGIFYHLKDGSTVQRRYEIGIGGEIGYNLLELQTQQEYIRQKSAAFNVEPSEVKTWTITSVHTGKRNSLNLNSEKTAQLLSAIQEDLLARTPDGLLEPQLAYWSIEFTAEKQIVEDEFNSYIDNAGASFVLTADMSRTSGLLGQWGYDAKTPDDLSDCTSARISRETAAADYYSSSDGAVSMFIPGGNDAGDDYIYDQIYGKEYVSVEAQSAVTAEFALDENAGFVEVNDPEQIKKLAEGALGTCSMDESVYRVIYTYDDYDSAYLTLLAADSLPKDVLALLTGESR